MNKAWPIAALPLALLVSGAVGQTRDTTIGEIPGHRGELIKPLVPGPPTYTGPKRARPEGGGSGSGSAALCELPSRSYLDSRRANPPPPLDLATLYDGWLAGELLGEKVVGSEGEELGEIQDILVGPDGEITALTVEGGGFLEIGDAAFRVAWSKVRLTPDHDGVQVALSRAEAERGGLFDGPETVDTEQREFRVSEIRGDWTRIGNETNPCFVKRGYVREVVMDSGGRIIAILETRSARLGGGTYAYPFLGYQAGWRPFYGYYDLPFENMSKPAPRVDLKRFSRM